MFADNFERAHAYGLAQMEYECKIESGEIEIKCLDILKDKVYIEYVNNDSDYISFTIAKERIKRTKQELISYTCVDATRAVDFVNNIPNRHTLLKENKTYLRIKDGATFSR